MKDTSNFRTKTQFITRNNGKIPGVWEIAIDLGYSAVKVFSPTTIARFPSYARRVPADFSFVGQTPRNAILYKDMQTEETWLVGEIAQDTVARGDTTDSEASLYGRERYGSAMFRVIADTGLGLALSRAEFAGISPSVVEPGSDHIVIQTGLPEKYMDDREELVETLAGKHDFSIKVGTGEWKHHCIQISSSNVYVMSQPKGTLFSVCINKNGRFHPDAQSYLSSSVVVFDAGFGTLDIFPIRSGVVGSGETYSDLGMKRVLQDTSRAIKKEYKVDVPVPAMQSTLATGLVRYMDKKAFVSKEYPIGDILANACAKVCDEAIARITNVINLLDYNYMIITGGTGAAWFNQIHEKFKGLDTLKIIKGNQNDDLPFVYANVRGYYFYRYNKLGK